MTELNKIEESSLSYENRTQLRYLTQLAASLAGVAGSPISGLLLSQIDFLFSQKATKINENRIKELIDNVSERLNLIDESKLDKDFLASEHFFEIFRRCADIVARTVSDEKRKLVADYLSGVIQAATIEDISGQLLEDLNTLQEFHLQILAALPQQADEQFSEKPPESLDNMESFIYKKGIADLERLGFIQYTYNLRGRTTGNSRITTEYLAKFKETFKRYQS